MIDPTAILTAARGGVNWQAVGALGGPIMATVAWVGRRITAKVDKVREHLDHQDVRGNRMDRRMVRVETALGLQPLPRDD